MVKGLRMKYNRMTAPVKMALWFLVCSFLQRGIGLITTPIFTRIMTDAEFGRYSVYNSWYSIISVFATLSISGNCFTRELVVAEDERKKYELASSLYGLIICIIAGFGIIYLCLQDWINRVTGLNSYQFLRDDYEKLRKYFFSQPIDYLFYDHYETEGFHTSPHAILRIKGTHVYFKGARSCKYASSCDGIYIDIFPIDSLINDEKKAQKQMKEFNIIERLIILKSALAYGEKTSPIKIILKKVISDFLWFISFKSLNQRLDNIMKRYHSEKTTNVIIMILPDIKKNIFPRACFQEPKILDFEGKKFPAPTRPEEFLTIHYSDYMTCPHEKERWDYIDNFIEDVDFGNYPPLIKFIKEKRLGE